MKKLPILVAILAATGCPAVHTMRTAEAIPVGEHETVVHVGLNGGVVGASAEVDGQSESGGVGVLLPWTAVSFRIGLAQNLDFQIKSDLSFFPELSLGYQFIGGAGQGGLAASATIGAKWLSFGAANSEGAGDGVSIIYMPVTGMVDLPVGAHKIFARGGAMVIAGGGESVVKPMVGLGASVKLGSLKLLPEIDYMHAGTASESSGSTSASIGAGLLALGIGFGF